MMVNAGCGTEQDFESHQSLSFDQNDQQNYCPIQQSVLEESIEYSPMIKPVFNKVEKIQFV